MESAARNVNGRRSWQNHEPGTLTGGYLYAELRPNGAESEIVFQLRDVAGAVGYERKFKRSVA